MSCHRILLRLGIGLGCLGLGSSLCRGCRWRISRGCWLGGFALLSFCALFIARCNLPGCLGSIESY